MSPKKNMDTIDFNMDLTSLRLHSLLGKNNWNKNYVTKLFEALVMRFKGQEQQTDFDRRMAKILYMIEIHKIHPNLKLGEDNCSVIELVNDADINEDKLLKILAEGREKNLVEILEELSPQNGVNIEKVKNIVSNVWSALSNGHKHCLKDDMEKYLFDLCQAVRTCKWKPRISQMVSWCLLALSESSHLLQVRTGEGKSCIVAMFAAYRALKGEKVDIISSSPVLAERDRKDWEPFYKKFKLKVGCNIGVSSEAAWKKCYESDIVYGTTSSFAGDWLRHHFLRKEVRGNRKFQCVIVDEVDSLMLDKGLEVVYLSDKIPAMQSMNTVLLWIWCLVSQHKKMDRGIIAGPIKSFVLILEETTGITTDADVLNILKLSEEKHIFPQGFTSDIKYLNSEIVIQKLKGISETQMVDFFGLVETQLTNYCFSLFSEEENGSLKRLDRTEGREIGNRNAIQLLLFKGGLWRQLLSDKETIFSSVEQGIKKVLQFTGPEKTPKDSHIIGFQDLVYSRLRVWVENAFRAKEMALGDEYVAQGETVVPVDYQCTGVVQNNMRWGDGLQQFLEMKHQAKVSNMTVITNFMSNVRLFRMYGNQVFGVTGTLGSEDEIEILQKLYGDIHTSTMPSFRRRKLFEEEGKILTEEADWLEAICSVIREKVNQTPYRGERAVLVICETINRSEAIKKAVNDFVQAVKIKSYTDNNLDSSEVTKTLNPRDVIIATNLAGRGTDFQVSEKVNEAGGLFVLQTFLPLNIRVEQQAFGRTGRQGNPGSAQLIMCATHFSPSVLQILTCFIQPFTFIRGTAQKHLTKALMTVLRDHLNSQSEQQLPNAFDHLLTQLETLNKKPIADLKKARDNLVKQRMTSYLTRDIEGITKKENLFSCYLHLLEEIHKKHKNSKTCSAVVESMHECWGLWLLTRFDENESEETLKCMFKEAMENAQELLEKEISPSSAISFYIRHGNVLRLEGFFERSIEIYSKALEENDQDFIALYNRALSVMQLRRENYVTEALRDLEKADKSIDCTMKNTEDALQYVAKIGPAPLAGQITVFRNQLCVRLQVCNRLKKNINEALNKLKIAHNNGGGVTVAEHHIFTLVDLQYLLQHPIDVAEELKNLKLLGLTQIISLNTTFSLAGFFSRAIRRLENLRM